MENSIEDLCLLENNQLGKTYMKRIFPVKSFKNGREQVESVEYQYLVRDIFVCVEKDQRKKETNNLTSAENFPLTQSLQMYEPSLSACLPVIQVLHPYVSLDLPSSFMY